MLHWTKANWPSKLSPAHVLVYTSRRDISKYILEN